MENNENLNNLLICNSIKLASTYTKMTRLKSKEIDNDIINRMRIKSDDKQMKDTRKIEKHYVIQ